jgi:hypothetical protein
LLIADVKKQYERDSSPPIGGEEFSEAISRTQLKNEKL